MKTRWRHKRVGLALGSGGARGWAHLGVLQALREKEIQIDYVAGTSMGSVVGAFFAAGREAELRELALDMDWKRLRPFFWEVSLSRSGLTDGKKLLEEVYKMIGVRNFSGLPMPFRAVATDLNTGSEVVLSSGNLLQAMRASISIPGLFSPVWVGKHLLVDGGLVNPVPVNVVRAMGAQVVISVDVSQGIDQKKKPVRQKAKEDEASRDPLLLPKVTEEEEHAGPAQMLENFFAEIEKKARRLHKAVSRPSRKPIVMDVLVQSVRIAESQIALTRRQTEPPDVLVEPNVGAIGTLDFQRAKEAIAIGYAATLKALGQAG